MNRIFPRRLSVLEILSREGKLLETSKNINISEDLVEIVSKDGKINSFSKIVVPEIKWRW